jgi:hypothetical protein
MDKDKFDTLDATNANLTAQLAALTDVDVDVDVDVNLYVYKTRDRTMVTTAGATYTVLQTATQALRTHTHMKDTKGGKFEQTKWGDAQRDVNQQDTGMKGRHVQALRLT